MGDGSATMWGNFGGGGECLVDLEVCRRHIAQNQLKLATIEPVNLLSPCRSVRSSEILSAGLTVLLVRRRKMLDYLPRLPTAPSEAGESSATGRPQLQVLHIDTEMASPKVTEKRNLRIGDDQHRAELHDPSVKGGQVGFAFCMRSTASIHRCGGFHRGRP